MSFRWKDEKLAQAPKSIIFPYPVLYILVAVSSENALWNKSPSFRTWTHKLYSNGNCLTCGCGVISVFTGASLCFYCLLNQKCLFFFNHSREKWSSVDYLLFFWQQQGRVVICFLTKSLSQFIMNVLDQNIFRKSLKVL